MDLYKFLRNEDKDFQGRLLSDIWSFTDDEIEDNYDFIQLIFPLDKPNEAVDHNIYLKDVNEFLKIKSDEIIKNNIIKSKDWFIDFLKRNDQWKLYSDHNQLRITRIIECLRLLISDDEADLFYSTILSMVGKKVNINEITLDYWSKA
tara:strand:+ start:2229 stop:2672 length:444 start_codon:yes stop_codon:yes gene_type:complete